MKNRFKFLTEKYRGSWSHLNLNIKVCLALDNIHTFPNIVAKWILEVDDFTKIIKDYSKWLFGSDIIPLSEEITEEAQKRAYQEEESISSHLLNVRNIYLFLNLTFFSLILE